MRVLLAIGLVAPAAYIFVDLGNSIDTVQSTAKRELLGVEYLRGLEPVVATLCAVESAVVSGEPAAVQSTREALGGAVQNMALTDGRIGAELGVRERWRDLQTRMERLPKSDDPRAAYTAYHDVTNLALVLFDRVGQLSGLSVDQNTDVYYLHQAVTTDLPRLTVATRHLADLAVLDQGPPLGVASMADLLEVQRDGSAAASRLVQAMETAATGTVNGGVIAAIYAPLDTVRGDLDRLTAADATIRDGEVSADDVGQIIRLQTNVAQAASALSKTIFDQLTVLLSARRDAAVQDRVFAVVALAVIVLLALAPIGFWARDAVRSQRAAGEQSGMDTPDPLDPGPQWTREVAAPTGRERAGAAR